MADDLQRMGVDPKAKAGAAIIAVAVIGGIVLAVLIAVIFGLMT